MPLWSCLCYRTATMAGSSEGHFTITKLRERSSWPRYSCVPRALKQYAFIFLSTVNSPTSLFACFCASRLIFLPLSLLLSGTNCKSVYPLKRVLHISTVAPPRSHQGCPKAPFLIHSYWYRCWYPSCWHRWLLVLLLLSFLFFLWPLPPLS